ncbi:hypothetical protein Plec18167_008998 [Paecilomyces lecythidis]|uniref:NADH dehydrogenase [ubiquinone] 1 beta subcomplex subunit 9 n=1 Tax=Paecilomyces lecythidis TaxID=3004212 RepID=A0ABR3WSA9_9EURO
MSLNPAASLYRRSLKLALDWAVHRQVWRGQAVYIRSLFEANRNVRDPRQQKVRLSRSIILYLLCDQTADVIRMQQVLFRETEKLLEGWKHPDPYRSPTAPGGSKYERNLPARELPYADRHAH